MRAACNMTFATGRSMAAGNVMSRRTRAVAGLSMRYEGIVSHCRQRRWHSSTGLVLGVYEQIRSTPRSAGEKQSLLRNEPVNGTPSFIVYDQQLSGALSSAVRSAGNLEKGKYRVFHRQLSSATEADNNGNNITNIFLVGVGKQDASELDQFERINLRRDNVREAVACGVRAAQDYGITRLLIDTCREEQAAAEAAYLQAYEFNFPKKMPAPAALIKIFDPQNKDSPLSACGVELWGKTSRNMPDEEDESSFCMEPYLTEESGELPYEKWRMGETYAEAQNYARFFMEMPSNLMTPTIFANIVTDLIMEAGSNVRCYTHDRRHIHKLGMGAFLAVARGSNEPPRFLEIVYNGISDDAKSSKNEDFTPETAGRFDNAVSKPVILIGKGVTSDSGAVSLKHSTNMHGDMGGAAVVAASIWAAVKLQLPINIVGLIPLTEIVSDGKAIKPGEVVRAMNGEFCRIGDTDGGTEGQLVLADVLCYACKEYPEHELIIDLASNGAMDHALGGGAAGVFSTCSRAYADVEAASVSTGDRVWRMPLFQLYHRQLCSHLAANIGIVCSATGRSAAGACIAAAFLRNFVSPETARWMHIDISGVVHNIDEVPYLQTGMSGRPTRTVIEFLKQYRCEDEPVAGADDKGPAGRR